MIDLKKELQDFIAQCHPAVFERIEYMESRNLFFPKSEYWESMLVRSVCNEIDFGWKMWQIRAGIAHTEVNNEYILIPKGGSHIL